MSNDLQESVQFLTGDMDQALLLGPYFIATVAFAFILAGIYVWSGRPVWMKIASLVMLIGMVLFPMNAINDLLSRPKPVTFTELQAQLPDGHPGHLVLYGEEKEKVGIYLLLRSPGFSEPRYYLMKASEKNRKQFSKAQQEAKKNNTQLLLGGKPKKGKSGKGGDKKKGKGDEDIEMEKMFHPAPVSGGPEKDMTTPEQPVVIPTPNRP